MTRGSARGAGRGQGIASPAAAAILAALAACAPPPDDSFEFALVGDNPYQPEHVPAFEALIDDVNDRSGLEWVIHVGDISGLPCTDEMYRSRFALFQRFRPPFVYTPGDNDWFDCVRDFQGGYDPYERLAFLRSVFFPDPSRTTVGRPMPVRSQGAEPGFADFVENALWARGPAVFATLHVVGLTREPTDAATANRRMDAAVAWTHAAFDSARTRGATGVFLATQVDPWILSGLPVLRDRDCEACREPRPGVAPLLRALIERSDAFAGQVVLAVGDTHVFRVDKPLYRPDGSLVENFTRVEAFGSPHAHWVRVRVDARDRQLFTFHQEVVPPPATGVGR